MNTILAISVRLSRADADLMCRTAAEVWPWFSFVVEPHLGGAADIRGWCVRGVSESVGEMVRAENGALVPEWGQVMCLRCWGDGWVTGLADGRAADGKGVRT